MISPHDNSHTHTNTLEFADGASCLFCTRKCAGQQRRSQLKPGGKENQRSGVRKQTTEREKTNRQQQPIAVWRIGAVATEGCNEEWHFAEWRVRYHNASATVPTAIQMSVLEGLFQSCRQSTQSAHYDAFPFDHWCSPPPPPLPPPLPKCTLGTRCLPAPELENKGNSGTFIHSFIHSTAAVSSLRTHICNGISISCSDTVGSYFALLIVTFLNLISYWEKEEEEAQCDVAQWVSWASSLFAAANTHSHLHRSEWL